MAALHNFGPYNVRHNQVVRGVYDTLNLPQKSVRIP